MSFLINNSANLLVNWLWMLDNMRSMHWNGKRDRIVHRLLVMSKSSDEGKKTQLFKKVRVDCKTRGNWHRDENYKGKDETQGLWRWHLASRFLIKVRWPNRWRPERQPTQFMCSQMSPCQLLLLTLFVIVRLIVLMCVTRHQENMLNKRCVCWSKTYIQTLSLMGIYAGKNISNASVIRQSPECPRRRSMVRRRFTSIVLLSILMIICCRSQGNKDRKRHSFVMNCIQMRRRWWNDGYRHRRVSRSDRLKWLQNKRKRNLVMKRRRWSVWHCVHLTRDKGKFGGKTGEEPSRNRWWQH